MLTASATHQRTFTPHARGVTLMLASAACFTANVLLTRVLTRDQSVDVYFISCARFVLGLGIIMVLFRREFQPSHLFRSRKLAERGIVGGAGVCGFYLTVAHLGAGRATFISTTYIVIAAVLATLVLRERFRVVVACGSVVALFGLALLTNVIGSGPRFGVYDVLALSVAFASAWVVVTIRQLHATEHTSTIFAAQCVYGLIICAPLAALHWHPLSLAAWSTLVLASVSAGAGQIMMTRAFVDLPVGEGSLLQMLVPIGIGAGGVLFFNEHFTSLEFLGAALILIGTVVAALRR